MTTGLVQALQYKVAGLTFKPNITSLFDLSVLAPTLLE
jgi:hypothetical protein